MSREIEFDSIKFGVLEIKPENLTGLVMLAMLVGTGQGLLVGTLLPYEEMFGVNPVVQIGLLLIVGSILAPPILIGSNYLVTSVTKDVIEKS
ncbi:hypothetical protein [Halorussus sp. MSC15.2]|uniref:hypothetical protein n=1 Tax=Halorussus sp. MSC15.2 TaxID=2283638 RepID=UPI0013CF9416|nr:hypothetical protein [Halorussus sp. MSC15.2]NEU56274.1 hypothetical protein [Halorussus sp. MSC15.2]